MSEQQDFPPKERWHVGKEIPLTLIFAILVQTLLLTSWLSGQLSDIRNNVTFMRERVDELRVERYTRTDAARDQELMQAREQANARAIEDHERRLREIEARLRNGLR